MKQVITYVANDGKSFDTEEECRLYENIISTSAIDEILFFDVDFRKIYFNLDLDCPLFEALDEAFFIVIKNMEQWEYFVSLLDEYYDHYYKPLIEIVEEPGIYFYCEEERWLSLKEEKKIP